MSKSRGVIDVVNKTSFFIRPYHMQEDKNTG